MTRLNVRCCCDGTKVLGTLQVDDSVVKARGFALRVFKTPPLKPFGQIEGPTFAYERVSIRDFWNGEYYEQAIYSEDRPIEFWRGLTGFTEGARV